MKTIEENISALERTILSEARAESDQIRDDAKSKADAIRQRAQEQANAVSKEILERAKEEATRLQSQALATNQLKARTLRLEHRERLLDRVFKTVRQQLPAVQKQDDYDQIVIRLIQEALTQLNVGKAQVRADQSTLKILRNSALEKISTEMKAELTLGKVLEQGIGVVVEASDGHLHYDNTLETRLNRLQSGLRSSVYRILVGETP